MTKPKWTTTTVRKRAAEDPADGVGLYHEHDARITDDFHDTKAAILCMVAGPHTIEIKREEVPEAEALEWGRRAALLVRQLAADLERLRFRDVELERIEYVITDGRPLRDAVVCDVCASLKEAQEHRPDYGGSAQIYRVAVVDVDMLAPESDWELMPNEGPEPG